MTTRIVTKDGPEWPETLSEVSDAMPGRLYARGRQLDRDVLRIAIVGTRRPTIAGIETTRRFATALVEAGVEVVSGMAVGIDAVAHRSALTAGGTTVGVLGCGCDVVYPRANSNLRERLLLQGTLLSEHPNGVAPAPFRFPLRNRVIAGIARGVIVIEGGLTSGALITARYALDFNRDVFAIPGSIRNPMAEGPNQLIRTSNARLVTDVDHVFEELAPMLVGASHPVGEGSFFECNETELAVLALLDDAPVSQEWLLGHLGIAPGALSVALSRLDVRGLVQRSFRGYVITSSGWRALAAASEEETA